MIYIIYIIYTCNIYTERFHSAAPQTCDRRGFYGSCYYPVIARSCGTNSFILRMDTLRGQRIPCLSSTQCSLVVHSVHSVV